MISPQTEEQSRIFVESKHLTMEILSDPGNKVAKKYGLVYKVPDDLKAVYLDFGIDLPEYNGDDSWTLPMPARYVIDRDGGPAYPLHQRVFPDSCRAPFRNFTPR
jgi:peroxiredoxin